MHLDQESSGSAWRLFPDGPLDHVGERFPWIPPGEAKALPRLKVDGDGFGCHDTICIHGCMYACGSGHRPAMGPRGVRPARSKTLPRPWARTHGRLHQVSNSENARGAGARQPRRLQQANVVAGCTRHSLQWQGMIEGHEDALMLYRQCQQVGVGELARVEQLAPVEVLGVQ
jgi:hypothetical protein